MDISLTQFEKMSILIGIVNFIVITIALTFYYRQAKAAQEQVKILNMSLERNTYMDFESSLSQLSKSLIQYPDLRPYLYDNKTCPKKEHNDYNVIISFCVLYLDFFDHVITMEKLSPGGTQWSSSEWSSWICDMLKNSPALRETLENEKDWYNEELYKKLEKVKFELNI